jgi:apolipoprotein N-acyltransferase
MIDPKGRVLGQIPLNTDGALDLPLPPAEEPTIYARYGDLPVGLLLVLISLAAFYRAKRD